MREKDAGKKGKREKRQRLKKDDRHKDVEPGERRMIDRKSNQAKEKEREQEREEST